MSDWNAKQYLLFKNERTQPSIDLANRLTGLEPKKIIDLGCGPANSTKVLYNLFPDAQLFGADLSADMLARAKQELKQAAYITCDLSGDLSVLGGGYDIVFSNAVLQWLDDHEKVLPNWMSLLAPGGTLAVQMPINEQEPAIAAIGELAKRTPEKFASVVYERSQPLNLQDYHNILSSITPAFSIWTTAYCHRMQTHEQILDWVRGARLRAYLDCLDAQEAADFEADLLARIRSDYQPAQNGEILFWFRRLFFTAVRPE